MGRSKGENGGCEKFFLFFLQTVFAYVLRTTKKEPTHNISHVLQYLAKKKSTERSFVADFLLMNFFIGQKLPSEKRNTRQGDNDR